jgi:hypothetical protein
LANRPVALYDRFVPQSSHPELRPGNRRRTKRRPGSLC